MRLLVVARGFGDDREPGAGPYVHALVRALVASGDQVTVLDAEGAGPAREAWPGFQVVRAGGAGPGLEALLDEVRPQVAHLHALDGLPEGLLAALDERAVPLLAVLHDHGHLCLRRTLRDDLGRPCPGPDPARCASCVGLDAPPPDAGAVRALALPAPLHGLGALARHRARSWAWFPGAGAAAVEVRLAERRRALARCARVLATSAAIEAGVLSLGADPTRVQRLARGVDPGPFRGRQRSRSPVLRVAFLGPLVEESGPQVLLEAARALSPHRVRVSVFGALPARGVRPGFRDALGKLLRQPHVEHHPTLAAKDAARVLFDSDVLALPSLWADTLGGRLAQARLAGAVPVASRTGALAEWVRDGQDGLLVPPGDAGALASALLRLADEPGFLSRLQKAAPRPPSIEEDAASLQRHSGELLQERGVPRPRAGPRTVAVVVHFRSLARTFACLDALERGAQRPDEVVVVDAGSHDGSAEFLRARATAAFVVEARADEGFPAGANLGFRRALELGADRVLLLDACAEVQPGTLAELSAALDRAREVGVVGPVVRAAARPDLVESAGLEWSPRTGRVRPGRRGQPFHPAPGWELRAVDGLWGRALLVRRDVLEAVGNFDPRYVGTFEDLDFCLRARAKGFGVACVASASVLRHEEPELEGSAARRAYLAVRGQLLLSAAHGGADAARRLLRGGAVAAERAARALLARRTPAVAGALALGQGVADYARGRFGPRA